MKSAAVYRRGGKIIIHPSSTTVTGIGVATPPFLVFSSEADDKSLGAAVRSSLVMSLSNLPHPADWSSISKPLLEAADVKTWSTFVRGTSSCDVVDDGGGITLTPLMNRGARHGFQSAGAQERSISSEISDEELGDAVRKALEIARGL